MRQVLTECSSPPDSPLAGLGHSATQGLPVSIIVTTIQRKRDLVVPTGSTKLQAGDELMLIGRSSDIDAIRVIAAGVDGRSSAVRPIAGSALTAFPQNHPQRPH